MAPFRTDASAPTATTEVTIDGMTCTRCVRHVEDALAVLDGVARAEVDLATGTARVTHRAGHVDTAALVAAVARLGYAATPCAGAAPGGPGL